MADREESDLFLGHPGFATDGYPRYPVGPDRYELNVVYLDGVPRTMERFDDLASALEAFDREHAAHIADGYSKATFCLRVLDSEDYERGGLTWDDLDR